MMHVRKSIDLVSFRNHMCTHMNTYSHAHSSAHIHPHIHHASSLFIIYFKEHYSSLKTENLAVGEKTEDAKSNTLLLYEARTLGMLVVFVALL